MASAPRTPGIGPWSRARMGRRSFLRSSLLAAVLTPALAEALSACGTQLYTSGDFTLPRPDAPVRWPLSKKHPRIEPGQTPKAGSTLKLYNYADYIGPGVIKAFEKKYGVNIEVSTFNDEDEALTKIATGAVDFDMYWPSYDQIGALVAGDLLRPLTHEYIPNLKNLWSQFASPWYDQGAQYSMPYTVYTTGIGWRTDMVDVDIATLDNPYDVFWDPANRGNCAVIDDWHTLMGMMLLRNGISDLNTGKVSDLKLIRDQLGTMQQATNPRVTITMYNDLPGGQYGIAQMWSGDVVNAQYYLPKHTSPDILRYWFPTDGRGMVDNDMMVLLGSGQNPVAAQYFINYMLDPSVAAANFGFIGYQPPQRSINPSELVRDQFVPKNLATTAVLPKDFIVGDHLLELSPTIDGQWHQIWQEYQANG